MLQSTAVQDSLVTVVRDSARGLLLEGGTDLRYFPEAWFFLGLAATIFGWCWRTWRDLHGAAPEAIADPGTSSAATEAPAGAELLRCPACAGSVGDTRSPLGYLTVCPACGRPISVIVAEGAPRVVVRDG